MQRCWKNVNQKCVKIIQNQSVQSRLVSYAFIISTAGLIKDSPCKCSAGRPVEGGCIDGIGVNGTTSSNQSRLFKPWKCQSRCAEKERM